MTEQPAQQALPLPIVQPSAAEPVATRLARLIRDGIRAWDAGRDRSRQIRLGPSSLGHSCLRHLAYYATGAPKGQPKGDPLPAILGTWGHSGLDLAFGGDPEWQLGHRVEIGPDLTGTYDLYHVPTGTVVDAKFLGTDALTRLRRHGPSRQYRVQVHTYGFGLMREGYDVRHVALACLPRSGFLRDILVWAEPWDEQVCEEALQRWYTLKEAAPVLAATPELFTGLPTADGPCSWCPWLSTRESAAEHPELGCAGHSGRAAQLARETAALMAEEKGEAR
jgi:hypothetical protein